MKSYENIQGISPISQKPTASLDLDLATPPGKASQEVALLLFSIRILGWSTAVDQNQPPVPFLWMKPTTLTLLNTRKITPPKGQVFSATFCKVICSLICSFGIQLMRSFLFRMHWELQCSWIDLKQFRSDGSPPFAARHAALELNEMVWVL